MANDLKGGSRGNCSPEYAQETLDGSEFGVGGEPMVLDTRGKAPKGPADTGPEEQSRLGGTGHVSAEAGPDDALGEFTKSAPGGRYGSAKSSKAVIPLSSNGPETRDGM